MKTIKLTEVEEKVLNAFKKFKNCPTNLKLSEKLKMNVEYVRTTLWKLVDKKVLKVNNKLKTNKFYVKK